MRLSGCMKSFLYFILVLALIALKASAQTDYPFRDPKLSDDERIADLLKRLTLDEKVELMNGHPKIPRLKLVFSDEAEGCTDSR
jgi:beta-glucosidase